MWKLGRLDISNVYPTSSTVFHDVVLDLHHNPQWPPFQRVAGVFIFTAVAVASVRKD